MNLREQFAKAGRILSVLGIDSRRALSHLQRIVETRGWAFALAYIKASRVAVMRYAAGNPLPNSDVVALDPDRLPAFLGPKLLSRIKRQELKAIREALTLLQCDHQSDFWADPSVKSIEGKPTTEMASGSFKSLCGKAKEAVAARGINIPEEAIAFRNPHMTSKQGPFGHALYSSQKEFMHPFFVTLMRPAIEAFNPPQAEHMELIDGITEDLNLLKMIPKGVKIKDGNHQRRQALVRAPAGKTRVIAILDYWTQTALRPQHQFLIKNFSKWFGECDRTLNQGGFDASSIRGPCFSFDLSSATDRFPMKFQREVMELLVGEEKATAWVKLLIGQPYYSSWLKTAQFYNAGQPMGAYSSWAVFTQCHHLVVIVAGHNVHKHYDFRNYIMLGDDLVIYGDRRVALEYRRLMTHVLGVEISEAKSQISEAGSFEFAKRFWVSNSEASHYTWAQLLTVPNPLTVQASFLADAVQRAPDEFTLNQGMLRRLQPVLIPSTHVNGYSVRKAIFLQSIQILKSRGIKTYLNDRLVAWLGISIQCSKDVGEYLDDVLRLHISRRLEVMFGTQMKVARSLLSDYEAIIEANDLVFLHAVPHFYHQTEGLSKVTTVLHDMSLLREMPMGELMGFLIEVEDQVQVDTQNYTRRLERVREIISHGTRRYRSYEGQRQTLMRDFEV